jgi:hypothetical protein
MQIGYIVAGLSALYALSWIPIAYKLQVLFPSEMLRKFPQFDQAIPLVVDVYVIADILLFPPLMGFIASKVWGRWETWQVTILYVMGLMLAYAFQKYVVEPGKFPCSLGGAGETNLLGWVHMPYFAAAATFIMMFILTHVSIDTTLVVALAMAIIIPMDTLVPLPFIKYLTGHYWIPNVFEEEDKLYWLIGTSYGGLMVFTGLKLFFG